MNPEQPPQATDAGNDELDKILPAAAIEKAQPQAMEVDGLRDLRVLALFCDESEQDAGYDPPGSSSIDFLKSRNNTEVEIMCSPSLEDFSSRVETFKPTFVYIRGPFHGLVDSVKGSLGPVVLKGREISAGELVSALEDTPLDTVYLDAAAQEKVVDLLRTRGVPHVLFWSEDPTAVVAAHFAASFFGTLSLTGVTIIESYALGLYATQAHCGIKLEGKLMLPGMPDLLAGPIGDTEGVDLQLPDNSTVQLPEVPGLDMSCGIANAVAGWSEVRLLAPRAELRLLVAGDSGMVDAVRLSYLGEALRALLVLEARGVRLISSTPCIPPPSHLPNPCQALHCQLETASGARVAVVLGAPPDVGGVPQLLEHALRHTLVADSLSLQFRLPPVGVPLPSPRVAPELLQGTPAVDCLVMTSVWVVHVLRLLAQSASYRGLMSLGIPGVGNATTAGATPADALRYHVLVTGGRPVASANGTGEPAAAAAAGAAGAGGSAAAGPRGGRGEPSSNPMAILADPPVPRHGCSRAPLSEVSEEDFLADVVAFLTARRGRSIDRAKFPDAVLNGTPLDLFGLYREVATRGGFRVGNGINWKGQVFAHMRNWTAHNRQTGVGNSLKKHYANYLWEYEQAHPQDVQMDRCNLCGCGEEEGAVDWIACDRCNSWVHFSCDTRPGLGSFSSYVSGEGKSYTCPNCQSSPAVAAADQQRDSGAAAAAGAAGGQPSQQQQQEQQGEEQDMKGVDDPMES